MLVNVLKIYSVLCVDSLVFVSRFIISVKTFHSLKVATFEEV